MPPLPARIAASLALFALAAAPSAHGQSSGVLQVTVRVVDTRNSLRGNEELHRRLSEKLHAHRPEPHHTVETEAPVFVRLELPTSLEHPGRAIRALLIYY